MKKPRKKTKLITQLKDYLLLGLLAVAPLALTLWLLFKITSTVDNAAYDLFSIVPKEIFGVHIPGLGILVTVSILICAGLIAKTVTGKVLQNFSDYLLSRVPVISGLYNISKQMSQIFFSSGSSATAFKKVVVVNFPHNEARTLAFVTGKYDSTHTLVFVPTAPNPTSGYVLIYADKDLEDSSLGVEEAVKMIVSCGALKGSAHSSST